MIDWAYENRAWLQLHEAGLLADGVTPRHLRESRDEVEKQREAEELAEAAYREWTGQPAPTPVRRETTAAEREAREFAEAWARMSG